MKRDEEAVALGVGNYTSPDETAPVARHLRVIVGALAASGEVHKDVGVGQFVDVTPDDPLIAIRKVPADRQSEQRDSRVFLTKRTPFGPNGQQQAVAARLGIRGFMAPG